MVEFLLELFMIIVKNIFMIIIASFFPVTIAILSRKKGLKWIILFGYPVLFYSLGYVIFIVGMIFRGTDFSFGDILYKYFTWFQFVT